MTNTALHDVHPCKRPLVRPTPLHWSVPSAKQRTSARTFRVWTARQEQTNRSRAFQNMPTVVVSLSLSFFILEKGGREVDCMSLKGACRSFGPDPTPRKHHRHRSMLPAPGWERLLGHIAGIRDRPLKHEAGI